MLQALLYISLPSLQCDFDVKLRVYFLVLWITGMQDNDFRFLFLNFDTVL